MWVKARKPVLQIDLKDEPPILFKIFLSSFKNCDEINLRLLEVKAEPPSARTHFFRVNVPLKK
jgi:hypothetical protein